MHRFLTVLTLSLLVACTGVPDVPGDHAGAHAGKVVIGIGATADTSYSSYSLLYRRMDQRSLPADQQQVGRVSFFQKSVSSAHQPDYENPAEEGVVLVETLPPAEYEIFNFEIFSDAGLVKKHFSSRQPFSIPFRVAAGKTTYLGNYQANRIIGKNIFGAPLPNGAVFAVTSRADDDLRLSRGKDMLVSADAIDATPAPGKIGSPFFVELR
jgi:hypothetical protein